MLASATAAERREFLEGLEPEALRALPYLFDFWALPHQMPPEGDWRSWLILGGRGAGKTRAGAEWVRAQVEGPRPASPGRAHRVALIGETLDQAREVMVFGESGILACSPPDRRPSWIASRRLLKWPNGAEAQVFSAQDPEALRGPQFDAVWADEFAKWKRVEEVWDMVMLCLRLGDDPRACVTTTPRPVPALKALMAEPTTVSTHAPTHANRANLSSSFLDEVHRRYAGTRIGRQELDGLLVEDIDGALWTHSMIEAVRTTDRSGFSRVVVGVDPSVAADGVGDACGIVVVGVHARGEPRDWRAVVLEDASVQAKSPLGWAQAVVAAVERHGADRVVAEINQGGGLVESLLRQVDSMVPFRGVHATKSKPVRAEPVAALYEQGRILHGGVFPDLEDQMTRMTVQGYQGSGSPDRLDALVWAVHETMIAPARHVHRPVLRAL